MKSILVFMFLMVMVTVSILYMIKPKEKLVSFSPNIITINDKIEDRYRQFLSKIDKYRINGSKKYSDVGDSFTQPIQALQFNNEHVSTLGVSNYV